MPELDEAAQQRQDFVGNGTGWSANQRAVSAEPPPVVPDAPAAPSAEEAVPSAPPQEPAPEQGTPPSTPPEPEAKPKWNLPPEQRWEELRQQREAAEQRARQAEEFARLALERTQTAPPQALPPVDPWEGLINHPDPATAQFWQTQRKLMHHEREQGKQDAIAALRPVIEAGTSEIARLNLKDFRKENPDIKPGSEDERLVTAYMNGQMDGVRHPLESAKRNAMFDKLQSENQALKAKQSLTPQKRAAAQPETSAGIPATAGLPGRPGDWRERAGEIIDKGGTMQDVLSLVFGKGRR